MKGAGLTLASTTGQGSVWAWDMGCIYIRVIIRTFDSTERERDAETRLELTLDIQLVVVVVVVAVVAVARLLLLLLP